MGWNGVCAHLPTDTCLRPIPGHWQYAQQGGQWGQYGQQPAVDYSAYYQQQAAMQQQPTLGQAPHGVPIPQQQATLATALPTSHTMLVLATHCLP